MPKLMKSAPEPAASAFRPIPRVSLSVEEAAVSTGLSRSYLYTLMNAGRLRFVKVGARRLIPFSELEFLLAGLPPGPEAA